MKHYIQYLRWKLRRMTRKGTPPWSFGILGLDFGFRFASSKIFSRSGRSQASFALAHGRSTGVAWREPRKTRSRASLFLFRLVPSIASCR